MPNNKREIIDFLDRLDFLLSCCERTYKEYQKNNAIFLYAKILKVQNEKIKNLIEDKGYFLLRSHIAELSDLLNHLNVWSALWELEYEIQKPSGQDVFVFQNTVIFPKESVKILLDFRDNLVCEEL